MSSNDNDTSIINKANPAVVPPLTDPNKQDLFIQQAPNALAPNFIYNAINGKGGNLYEIVVQQAVHQTGIKDSNNNLLNTRIWGYGENNTERDNINVTWPGKTFVVNSNIETKVTWINGLRDARNNPLAHLLAIDTTNHWAYSLNDRSRNLGTDGVPLVTHLHGGNTDSNSDGNPEYFEGLTANSRGPRYVSNNYTYGNTQDAGTLWYHDHALGITRLNVYTGLAGFYIIRDDYDTGLEDNPLSLPADDHELAYCVQDRSFKTNGDYYYPTSTNPNYPPHSIVSEIFGDHILVNGKIWPKTDVEPCKYRIRLLNGSDTRFMRIRFRSVALNETSFGPSSPVLNFTVIGSDQGFLRQAVDVTKLDFMPAERLDIIFDFASVPENTRIIIENTLGDVPITSRNDSALGARTNRIIAFDITRPIDSRCNFDKNTFNRMIADIYPHIHDVPVKTRNLGLFGTRDEFGRMVPMLGTAEMVKDENQTDVQGSLGWSDPVTENPNEGDTEIWNFYNTTDHAHPIHVHLVHFDILSRKKFTATVQVKDMMIDGKLRKGKFMTNIVSTTNEPVYESERGPKDMVICYPNEVTQIRMKFDKPGRYVWHCHILSHEDHEMMRPIYVTPK
ncbi:MAG: multicopper oxidase family protein [Thiohalomonadales bacterium]